MRLYAIAVIFSSLLFLQNVHAAQEIPVKGDPTSSDLKSYLSQTTTAAEFREVLRTWIGDADADNSVNDGPLAGLIDYLTNHLQAEHMNDGWRYRKNIMLDYLSYVLNENEVPLRGCAHGNDDVAKVICKEKGSMVFHMLRGITGDDIFFDAVRQFICDTIYIQASWTDISAAFEKASGRNLEWFFSQWLDRKGLPDIEVKNERLAVVKGSQTVSFDIIQKTDAYRFTLPVTIKTNSGEVTHTLHVEKEQESFDIIVDSTPFEIVFDKDYSILRRISDDESLPLISRLLGDNKKLLILPGDSSEKYAALIMALEKAGFSTQDEYAIKDEDIRSHSLLILGYDGPVVRRLFGKIDEPSPGFTLSSRKNPLNTDRVIVIAHADAGEDIPPFEAIRQSGRFSYVRFIKGVNVQQTTDDASRGISVNVYRPSLSIRLAKVNRLEDDIKTIITKPIIYVGERHTNYEDHKTQLEIIMKLHEEGHTFAIGMEMFQKPFQKDIDDYLTGLISEKDFLKKTQYFKRWQFDYNLYREIVEYAKAKNIPIVGLNIWTEIVKKVSTDGIDSLTDIERSELPRSMDMSDEAYRERLFDVFKQHKIREEKSFENFYQSQILWDETMAQSIDDYMRKNPGRQMVVLAGAGHLAYGSGIPKRTYRLNNKDYVIILPGGEFIDTTIGDYLVVTEPLDPPPTLKLGIVLKERDDHVEIEKVVPGSVAKSLGLEKSDILVSLDDWNIEDIHDVNIFMLDKKRGEQVRVTVLRKKFLLGYREVILSGTL